MVNSPNIVDAPVQPTLQQVGMPELDARMVYGNGIIPIHDIEPDDIQRMMRSDGEVAGLYRILTTPLRGSQIEVIAKHQRGNREADFVEEVFTNPYADGGMRIPFKTVIATILRMLIDGWSPHEIVWDIRDGYVRIDKIEYRPINTIELVLDEHRNLSSYKQDLSRVDPHAVRRTADGKVTIAPDKVLHFVHSPEFNYFFGKSIFTQAFYHYEKKHKLYYISHIAAQINALRLRYVKIPAHLEHRRTEIMEKVGKLGFNSSISLPDEVELELLDTGSTFPDLLPLIQHHDAQMAKSVLAQVVDVGVEGRTGSFNLSDTHFDIFIENLGLMADYIADIINAVVIPKLIDWNFGTDAYPTVRFFPFDRQVKKQLFSLFTQMSTANTLNVTPEFLLEVEGNVASSLGLEYEYTSREDTLKMFEEKIKADPPPSQGGTADNRVRSRPNRDQSQR